MSSDYLVNPAIFLIDTLFNLYTFALLFRFLLQWMEADYYNPISQFLIRVTQPPLRLLRRIIPSLGRVDMASALLMLILQALDVYLVFLLQGHPPGVGMLAVLGLVQLLEMAFNLFFFAIIVRAVLSWVGSSTYNPAVSLLYSLTEPMLRYSRKLLPAMGGIDLSPLIPLMGIQLAKMIILPPLQQIAMMLN